MFDTTKPWWQSKSVWASIVAILAAIAGYFRFEIAAADQAQLVEAITTIATVAGGVFAALFRVTATTQIGPKP